MLMRYVDSTPRVRAITRGVEVSRTKMHMGLEVHLWLRCVPDATATLGVPTEKNADDARRLYTPGIITRGVESLTY